IHPGLRGGARLPDRRGGDSPPAAATWALEIWFQSISAWLSRSTDGEVSHDAWPAADALVRRLGADRGCIVRNDRGCRNVLESGNIGSDRDGDYSWRSDSFSALFTRASGRVDCKFADG